MGLGSAGWSVQVIVGNKQPVGTYTSLVSKFMAVSTEPVPVSQDILSLGNFVARGNFS